MPQPEHPDQYQPLAPRVAVSGSDALRGPCEGTPHDDDGAVGGPWVKSVVRAAEHQCRCEVSGYCGGWVVDPCVIAERHCKVGPRRTDGGDGALRNAAETTLGRLRYAMANVYCGNRTPSVVCRAEHHVLDAVESVGSMASAAARGHSTAAWRRFT